MAMTLDELRQQAIPKIEALFERLAVEQNSKTYTPQITPPPTFNYRTPVGTEAFIAKLDKKEAPQQVQAVAGNKLEGYAARWNDATGNPYVDTYDDVTVPNSWSDCIRYWEAERKKIGRPALMPHLRDHKNQIGGVLHLSEDSQGVIYQSQLSDTPLAKETWALAKDGFLGTSYGYEPTQYDYAHMSNRKVRRLLKIMAHEISSVTFPANPYASAIAKSGFTTYTSLEEADQDMQRLMLSLKTQRELDASLEERQKQIRLLEYRLTSWFNGMEVELQLQQQRQSTSPMQNTGLKDAMARVDDMFNDWDIMVGSR
jgi:HK97 family phage prohead protease